MLLDISLYVGKFRANLDFPGSLPVPEPNFEKIRAFLDPPLNFMRISGKIQMFLKFDQVQGWVQEIWMLPKFA
jgi:hypothetical protein